MIIPKFVRFILVPSLAPNDALQNALLNPETMVIDIRRVDEIAANGYWQTGKRWVNAPGSRTENPLLSVAAEALIPDPTTPVIVYCAHGFRSSKAKEILEAQGYVNVMNAGGFPDDMLDL